MLGMISNERLLPGIDIHGSPDVGILSLLKRHLI